MTLSVDHVFSVRSENSMDIHTVTIVMEFFVVCVVLFLIVSIEELGMELRAIRKVVENLKDRKE